MRGFEYDWIDEKSVSFGTTRNTDTILTSKRLLNMFALDLRLTSFTAFVFLSSASHAATESTGDAGYSGLIVFVIILFLLSRFFRPKCPACKPKKASVISRNRYHQDVQWRPALNGHGPGSYKATRIDETSYRCKTCGYQFSKASKSHLSGGGSGPS